MTGPKATRPAGGGRCSRSPPRLLVVEDGFADETGAPNPDMPTMVMRVEITDRPGASP